VHKVFAITATSTKVAVISNIDAHKRASSRVMCRQRAFSAAATMITGQKVWAATSMTRDHEKPLAVWAAGTDQPG
jgi:hypothetical protein